MHLDPPARIVARDTAGLWLWRDGALWLEPAGALAELHRSPEALPGRFVSRTERGWRVLAAQGGSAPDAEGSERQRLAASGGRRARALGERAAVVAGLRRWLDRRGFLEVQTPAVTTCPGLELHLDAAQVRLTPPGGDPRATGQRVERWLTTSPELHLKRLLVGGMTQPYSLGPVWRAGERGRHHNPEFTMLEWYRAGASLQRAIDDTVALVRAAARVIRQRRRTQPDAPPGPPATSPVRRVGFLQALAERADLNVGDATDDARIMAAAERAGLRPAPDESAGDLLLRAFAERVEPTLAEPGLTVIERWPARLASLARRTPAAPHLAERFELYWGGVELANGFDELTDADEQRERCLADLRARHARGLPRYPLDERFLAALVEGCPPAAGVALGVDRLVMVAGGYEALDDVIAFPFELV